jgi:hypothetical protein
LEESNQDQKGEWPHQTNIWCRYCCHPFDTTPIPMPVSFDRNIKQYAIYGNYCSFACASAWLREHNFPDVAYQRSLLSQMASDVFDYTDPIYAAPPSERLIVFGGDMTIEDFRAYSKTGKQCFVRTVPLIGSLCMLEEHVPPNQHKREEEKEEKHNNQEQNQQAIISVPIEQDIVVHEETVTASGKVPEGGLFRAFIEQQQLKKDLIEQEARRLPANANENENENENAKQNDEPKCEQNNNNNDNNNVHDDDDDVVMKDPETETNILPTSPNNNKTIINRKRKAPPTKLITVPSPQTSQPTSSLLQFMKRNN